MKLQKLALAFVCSFVAASAAAQSADLAVTKLAPATATVGSTITFQVTLINNGPDDASNAGFIDSLPADATFVSNNQTSGPTLTCTNPNVNDPGGTVNCTIGTLTAGSSASFDISVTVSPSAAGTTLINTVNTQTQTPDDNDENNTAITGTDVPGGNSADVSITKTGPASAAPNSDVTFTITVTNNGPNAADKVSFTDTLPNSVPPGNPMTFVSFFQTSGPTFNCGSPAATTTCTLDPMPAGTTATFTFTGHIPNTAPSGATYTNDVTVTSANDPSSENNTGSTTVTVSSADVGVVKSAAATAIAGGPTFNYVVTLSNSGPDAATDASFLDNLPAGIDFVALVQNTGPAATCNTPPSGTNGGVACTIALFGNGQSAQFTITVQAEPTVTNGTVANNTATASSSSFDPNGGNNSSNASTTISAQADLSITKSAPATVNAGSNMSYTIAVTNNGPSTASNASWTDTLPANTSFVSLTQNTGPTFNCTTGATVTCSIAALNPSTSASFTLTVLVSPAAPNASTISNTANVTSSTPDGNGGNNSANASTQVIANADLSVVKTGPASIPSNTQVTYTVTVANGGPASAATVSLTDTVPAGLTFASTSQTTGPAFNCTNPPVNGTGTITCTIATLASGASATFQFTFNVPPSVTAGTVVTNTATASATTPDPNPSNNSSTATTTVTQPIPALSTWLLIALGLAMAAIAVRSAAA